MRLKVNSTSSALKSRVGLNSLLVAVVYCSVSNPAGLPSEQNTRLFFSAAWPMVAMASRLVANRADTTVVWRMTIPVLVCSYQQRAYLLACSQADLTDPTHSKCPSQSDASAVLRPYGALTLQ